MRGVDRSLKARGSEKDNLLKRGEGLTAMLYQRSGPFSIRVGFDRPGRNPQDPLVPLGSNCGSPTPAHPIACLASGAEARHNRWLTLQIPRLLKRQRIPTWNRPRF